MKPNDQCANPTKVLQEMLDEGITLQEAQAEMEFYGYNKKDTAKAWYELTRKSAPLKMAA